MYSALMGRLLMLQCFDGTHVNLSHKLIWETIIFQCFFVFVLSLYMLISVFHMFVCRSAKEAEDKIKKALDKGEVLPTEARFDSNCITPGRIFRLVIFRLR